MVRELLGYLASDSYFSLKNVCWRLLIYLIILIVLVNEMKKIAMNESVYVRNIYRFFSFRNTTITMSMKWKINDIRISSCSDLNYIRMVCKKICTIIILYLYSNNLVFDVGVQLQDICFQRP